MPDSGYSWIAEHISSLHAIPINQLASLSLVRQTISAPITAISQLDALAEDTPKPVPAVFMDNLRFGGDLTHLECDWWSWSVANVKLVTGLCTRLEVCYRLLCILLSQRQL